MFIVYTSNTHDFRCDDEPVGIICWFPSPKPKSFLYFEFGRASTCHLIDLKHVDKLNICQSYL